MVSFPRVLQSVICPVLVCPAVCHSAGRLREHFMFRHFRSWIVVFQEGREPLPRCNMCGMHMSEGRLVRNSRTERCELNMQMKLRQRDVEIAAKRVGVTFVLTGDDRAEFFVGLESFKYLGRVLHRTDED